MKRSVFLCVLILTMAGCATISSVTAPNRERLFKLSVGMDKQTVLKTMGTRRMKVSTEPFHAVVINNPYRSETLNDKDGKSYSVLYYVTDDKNDDDSIDDADLTPLIFDGDKKLIGWGQTFMKDFIEKNEVKTADQGSKMGNMGGMGGFGKKKKK